MRTSDCVCICLLSLIFGGVACDGDGHPDSGYGANQPVPKERNCDNLCARMADCFGHLCAEDTGQQQYEEASHGIEAMCESTCDDESIESQLTTTAWNCTFTSSCRQALGDDACHIQAHYDCRN